MVSISKVIMKAGGEIFHHITSVLWVSICWSLFIIPALFILDIYLALIYLLFVFFPVTVAAYAMMSGKLGLNKAEIASGFFKNIVKFYHRSFGIGLVFFVSALIPISTWWYYLETGGYMLFLFSVFQTYLCATFMASQVYTIPFLVMEDLKVFQAMNKSIQLFLGKIWYSVGLFIQIACITVLLGLTVVGFLCLYIGISSVFVLHAARNLTSEKSTIEVSQS